MRRSLSLVMLVASVSASCASAQNDERSGGPASSPFTQQQQLPADSPRAVPPSLGAPADLPPPPTLTDTEARAEAARLALLLRAEVPRTLRPAASRRAEIIARARSEIEAAGHAITRPQLVVVVDRNPRIQLLTLVVAYPDAPWEAIGGTHVSTGARGRKYYYITPTGVFENTDAILGYRAQGTFNAQHIRGNGLKGMRVWDFGWHDAEKGWRADHETGPIRLEMHATDPQFLESRIGHPASEGCVRVPAAMNRFLDLHGVLDVDDERAAVEDIRFRALLLPNRVPTPLAGNMLVVIDTSDPPGRSPERRPTPAGNGAPA